MMRSLFSGVSGLKNHQTRMDVIGNNVSNVNTYGYKASRVTFQDMLSQTLSGAARPEETRGGVNPKQVGLGMTVASIDRLFTQGSIQVTGKNTDMAISGDGFFVVADGEKNFYTRAGTFSTDRDGTLVNPGNGLKVQGWTATTDSNGNPVIQTQSTPDDIVIPIYQKLDAKETTFVRYRSNLDSKLPIITSTMSDSQRASAAVTTNIDAYDNLGNPHRVTLTIWHTGVNQWTASASMSDVDGNITVDVPGAAGTNQLNPNNRMNLTFSPDGKIISASDDATSDSLNTGALTANVSYRIGGDPAIRNIRLELGTSGSIEGITQFSSPSTTKAIEQDGYGMGYMESFNIDNSGVITGVYSNGIKQPVAQVAMSVFTNPQGLTAAGENLFEVSNNSGLANTGPANSAGRGKIIAGSLEMSNVDLSDQFTDMIITQRGFQANSRTITTSDQMLQEVINLKR
jgi:flagellar hook protein FlgE